MATIADNLVSLANTKAKLKSNLYTSGIDSSAEDNFDDLVDMAFENELFSPDPAWPDIDTWTEDGAISFVMSNHGYGKVGFIVDTTDAAQYTVVINDGTTDISTTNVNSGVQYDASVTPGDGTTYYRVKITSSAAITRFYVKKPVGTYASNPMTLPILYFNANLSSLTSCASMFYETTTSRCNLLQAVKIKSTSNVTNMISMFYNCIALRSVPAVMDTSNVTNMISMFYNCIALRSVPAVMDTSNVTNMISMFYNCYALRSVPAVMDTSKVTSMSSMFSACYALRSVPAVMDTSKVTSMSNMFTACYALRSVPATLSVPLVTTMEDYATTCRSLERTLFDLTAATGLTKLRITQSQGVKGVTVSSSAPFSGTSPQIDISQCGLERTALVALFNSLPTVTGKTIVVTGNMGVPDLTAGDLAIATGKGWTVTTA